MTVNVNQYDQIDSTNTEAKRMAESGQWFGEPQVFIAKTQVQGRGQQGRIWESTLGGLYYSYLYKPVNFRIKNPKDISLCIGQVVGDTINEVVGVEPELKWPNDIMIEGRKVGGILVEFNQRTNHLVPAYIVVGVGLNVNQTQFTDTIRDIAISLFEKTGHITDIFQLSTALTTQLTAQFMLFENS